MPVIACTPAWNCCGIVEWRLNGVSVTHFNPTYVNVIKSFVGARKLLRLNDVIDVFIHMLFDARN